MSILAERKRKQKWSLNPRGKLWSEDANKFGQKMLEKMGWSHGKGLGAKEDGRTEHIKVSYKNDSQGMGYKETDDQWTEHQTNFTALLETLGAKPKESEIKLSSLEIKSQNSKARVHYKKFTRGKDLSRCSEKDLANIFGKRCLKEANKQVKNEVEETKETQSDEQCNNRNFSHGGLISEYFKKKLPGFGNTNGFVVSNNGVLPKTDESDTEDKPSFGFGFTQDNSDIKNINNDLKHRRKRSSESESELNTNFGFGFNNRLECSTTHTKTSFVSYINGSSVEGESISKKKKDKKKRALDDSEENIEDTPKKKKLSIENIPDELPIKNKKDKSKKKNQEDCGLSNPAFDPMFSPSNIEKHVLEPIEETMDESLNDTASQVAKMFEVQVQINSEVTPVKHSSHEPEGGRKKKKRKDVADTVESNKPSVTSSDAIMDQSEDQETPRKKKKKSKVVVEEMDTTENVNTNSESKESKKKKKKLKAESTLEGTNDSLESAETEINTKKKKSKAKQSEGIDNPFFDSFVEEDQLASETIENPYEIQVKPKKNKRKKSDKSKDNFAIENPTFNGIDTSDPQDKKNEEFEVKRKSKSNKKAQVPKEEGGISNLAINLNDSLLENCDLMLNICTTPAQPNMSKAEEPGSIQKVKTAVERRKSVRFSDVTRERIIPCKEELENETLDDSRNIVELEGKLNDSADLSYIDKFIQKKKAKKNKGLDNEAFDQQASNIEENITAISKTLDSYQAEIENDINENKAKALEVEDIMVGEVGNPDGTNEKLSDGSVKLKFKYASFRKSAPYLQNLTGAKKSYKHLIKGDIVLDFKESNLHEIDGYAVAKAS
ncbi:uncharacterized protein LOC126750467 [Anthonomus grandis grandis]|uniref:uncharacterized protein LOC126750467 n=1 Tax=Anthonomus grandis grandis TaxID=2921223 RepID=UPI0021667B47|nr:uncharacterized protein LOC126750467 [Anthonomus grandis grandis]